MLPLAFSGLLNSEGSSISGKVTQKRNLVRRFRGLFLRARYWLGPLSLGKPIRDFHRIVDQVQPDLIHAMRIPYEGMLARTLPPAQPFIVSIWGNDLTLHARGSAWMGAATRETLKRANGLLADTRRDLELAQDWDFNPKKPMLNIPGSGGLHLDEIAAAKSIANILPSEWMDGRPIIINPRGIRPGSVRTDTFFKAIPKVLSQFSQASFACPAMAGQPEAEGWVLRLGLAERVCLMPVISQAQLWKIYSSSQILVSVSEHDGTPNSVLEGMACGCFPIAGDIESLREWIEPGKNGLLVSPGDENALAEAISQAIRDPELRRQAAIRNTQIVASRADATAVMAQVDQFYRSVVQASHSTVQNSSKKRADT